MTRAARLLDTVRAADWVKRTGRIVRSVGLTVESEGPDARLGEICEISSRARGERTLAEVVGFAEGRVLLMPYEDLIGIESGSEVLATGESAHVDRWTAPARPRDRWLRHAYRRATAAAGRREVLAVSAAAQSAAPGHDHRSPRVRSAGDRHAADDRPRPACRHLLRQRRRQEHRARHDRTAGQGRRLRDRAHRRARPRSQDVRRDRTVERSAGSQRGGCRDFRSARARAASRCIPRNCDRGVFPR